MWTLRRLFSFLSRNARDFCAGFRAGMRERRAADLGRLEVCSLAMQEMRRREAAEFWFDPRPTSPSFGMDRRTPYERGIDLLVANLSPKQRAQYIERQCFEVIGSDTGKRYRIRQRMQQNIDELNAHGERDWVWCFVPRGDLVVGDVMLAQKLALELFENEALAVANRFPGSFPDVLLAHPNDAAERYFEYVRGCRLP